MSSFDRFSLTIARWLTNVYDVDTTAENYTTPGDVTGLHAYLSYQSVHRRVR